MMSMQDRLDEDARSMFTNEWQVAVDVSNARRRQDEELIQNNRLVRLSSYLGLSVVVTDHLAHCGITDAVIGVDRWFEKAFVTKEEADAWVQRWEDANPEAVEYGGEGLPFVIRSQVKWEAPVAATSQEIDNEIPF